MRLLTGLLLLCCATVASADLADFQINAPTTVGTLYAIGSVTDTAPGRVADTWPDTTTTIDELHCSATAAPGSGASWTVTVMTSTNAFPDIYAASTVTTAISGASQTHNADATHSVSWDTDAGLSFQIVTAGTVTAGQQLHCSVRVAGSRHVAMFGIDTPVSGTVTAFGSIGTTTTNDYQVFSPLLGTFGSLASDLTCVTDQGPGVGNSWNIRVRHWSFGWTNSPINCTITDTNVQCHDLVNTQSIGNSPDGVTFRVTTTGTPTAGAKIRCAIKYVF